jgi:hypothetical protein
MTTHRLTLPFHQGFFFFFTKKQHDCRPPTHPPFLLFPQLTIKLRDHHFDSIEVIEAETQAVPNTLIKHDFQDAFKK